MTADQLFDFRIRTEISKVRGAYLHMCADLEFLLVDITCMCLLKHESERNYIKEILVSNSMLSNKIKFAKKALGLYNKEYLERHLDCFTAFNELKEWRNKFSHSRIEGDNEKKDLDVLLFISYKDGELDEDKQSLRACYTKLPKYSAAIYKLTIDLIPMLYTERYYSRYSNMLQFPSNRVKAHWHNSQLGINQ